jgi:hypothetical protein
MSLHKIIHVKKEHIPLGIEKYKGKIDEELARHLKNAKLDYIPYVFEDGRVLMVLEILETGFLYPSKKVVFETLLNSFTE